MTSYFAQMDDDTQQELRERLPESLLERAAAHIADGIDLDTATDYDAEVERALWETNG